MVQYKRIIPIGSVVVMSLIGTAARAQAVGGAAGGQPDASVTQSTQVEDIVVTAQKRAENLQNVPITVTALTGADLAAHGVTNTLQLNAVVSGVNIRTTVGSFQPSIRGVGTSNSAGESPVSLYIDGVYLPAQREGIRDLNDIEQIAVLKGPQGTLFGRNSTGGVIQIQTRAPSHDFQGQVGVEVDNYATVKANAYVTGGLTSNLAASFSGQYSYQGVGWGKDYTTGNDTYRLDHQISLRSKILYQPTSRTNITLIADYMDRKSFSNDLQPYPGTSLAFPGVGPLKSVYDTYGGVDGQLNFTSGGGSLTVDQDLGFARVVSITSYRRALSYFLLDNSAVPGAFALSRASAPTHDITQEIQLISPKGRISWVTGAFYIHNFNSSAPADRITSGPLAPLATSIALSSTRATEITDSVAPFAQVDVELFPKTTLTGGVRYTFETRDFNGTTVGTRVNGATVLQASRTDSLSIQKPTFRVALDHQFTDDVLAYASFNTGFKSGGFNVGSPASSSYLPESLRAYEVGVKSQLLDRRLRLNLAGFYYQYTNVQVSQLTAGMLTVANGAGAELYGLDADVEAQLAPGLRLSGGIELEHAVFTSYPGAVFSTPLPTGGAQVFYADATGKRLPLAQNVNGNLSVDYHKQLSRGSLDMDVTGSYNGNYYFESDNFLRQAGYVLLDSSVGWNLPGGRITLSLWGRNLFDERVITQPSTQTLGYPTVYGQAPRTFGVAARAKF